MIPNFKNPAGTWDLRITCVEDKNRVYTILAQSTVTLTTNIVLPNGLVTVLTNDPELFYSVTSKTIGDFFNINFLITDSTTISANSRIVVELPTFD